MAEADTASDAQCKARTVGGERCSRPAGEDGFCHQHDESDPTVSDSETESDESENRNEDEELTEPEDVGVDPEEAGEVDADDDRIEGVLAIRETVQATAGELIGRPFDGVTEVTATQEGWRAIVEVVERRAVPDTQDVIGRYEIELDEDGVIQGYRRLDRYRRGDTAAFE
ncbi:gas vesicle protein GvpO, halophile-type [Saliphagus infecundisoli]|uniref:Gas vesicle protein GvpO, halophile-type n=1 Tax=Saliphagus infecundisoli TaxID=1849069 RepID=A0ABD5QG70_9EURY|nr:gas vesicle protein [Saliphagus infecundisoli]